MRRLRRSYYDLFSTFYDRFVALHSRDKRGMAREFLAEQVPVCNGGSVLDICTGTASLLPVLQEKVGRTGHVIGLDFSHGMLHVAREKTKQFPNIAFVEADAGCLPLATGVFDAVTCSHAFYELKDEVRERALREIVRILKPNGTFLMREHAVPANPVIRPLFYLRLASMGAAQAVKFLRNEQEELQAHFGDVSKIVAPAGRSKVLLCRKEARFAAAV